MSKMKITLIVKSKPLSTFLFTLFILSAVALSCKSDKDKEVKSAITIENLQTAYSKEMNRCKMYKAFITQAEKERRKEIAHLYRTLARSEEIHALNHLKMIQTFGVESKPPQEETIPIGTTMQTLKMALSMEEMEYATMYPNMIRCAEMEKHEDCVKHLRFIQDVDAKHGELLRYAIYKGKEFQDLPYTVCKCCGYILTTEETEDCPCCKAKKDMFEKV
ncbi:MAG: rubrerythrin family protein [Ignavibacteriales bacterium]|nr:rubrerythrin family protein [Ignavibacteriales bacterium]